MDENSITVNGFDSTITPMNRAAMPILQDIAKNLDKADQLKLILCYTALNAENYNYGLGDNRNYQSIYTDRYKQTRESISYKATSPFIDFNFDIDQDIDQNNCMQITNELDKILNKVANKICPDMTPKALRQFINTTFYPKSLHALENCFGRAIGHTQCNVKSLDESLEEYITDLILSQQNQSQGIEK